MEEKNLVIVESPAKAKTIEKILGTDYKVIASVGHIIDLPKSKLNVDVKDNFKPTYAVIKGKEKVIAELKKASNKSKNVFLASDPDREGEAIAWHISNALNLPKNKKNRIEFNEITKNAIKESIKSPRKIDMDMVNAQQARRILDRLVGYEITPFLWRQLGPNVSAGRVQSVTLKLICMLEDKIKKFIPVKFWDIKGEFTNKLNLDLYKVDDKKVDKVVDENIVNHIKTMEKKEFTVSEAKVNHKTKSAPNPLKTSTLQQLSASTLGFSSSKTMKVAQTLYEGIDTSDGHKGLITYMRTDSLRISDMAVDMAREYIEKHFGKEYIGGKKSSKNKQKIQDAHECIRPTDINLTPEKLAKYLNRDQARLYKLIWERFLISQLASLKYDQFEIIVNRDNVDFRGTINKITFDGYYKIFKSGEDLPLGDFPNINVGDKKKLNKLIIKEDFTKPPARFTESSIIKKLESEGIGRPSTYATIIETLKRREYVVLENKSLVPTEIGYRVKDILDKNFKDIMNVKFTANLEDELDDVANGEMNYIRLLDKFYTGLDSDIKTYDKKLKDENDRIVLSDIDCEHGPMLLKNGRWGHYLTCSKTKKEGGCGARVSLKGIEIDENEIKKGHIFVKEQVEILNEEKKGKLTDVFTKNGNRYILKTGRFGDYLESEDYENDNIRMTLPAEIRKMLKDNEIKIKDGIYKLNEKVKLIPTVEQSITDVQAKNGEFYILKNGRFGEYLESPNFKTDQDRFSLPSEIRKKIRNSEIEIENGIYKINDILQKIKEENDRLIREAGPCEKCGKLFKVGNGRWGKYMACTGYPVCRNTLKIDSKTGKVIKKKEKK